MVKTWKVSFCIFESICTINGRDNNSQTIALLSVFTTGAATSRVRVNARLLNAEGRFWEEVKRDSLSILRIIALKKELILF